MHGAIKTIFYNNTIQKGGIQAETQHNVHSTFHKLKIIIVNFPLLKICVLEITSDPPLRSCLLSKTGDHDLALIVKSLLGAKIDKQNSTVHNPSFISARFSQKVHDASINNTQNFAILIT